MRIFKGIIKILIIIILLIVSCIIYGFKIEPYLLTTKIIELGSIQDTKENFTIAQFSDTHIKEDFTNENLKKVVDKINGLSPDIVIFTGDLYDNYSKYNDDEQIISELNRINAKVAKIAIYGNRDYGGGAVREYENIMSDGGFVVLKNESKVINTGNEKNILITGIDDSMLGKPNMPNEEFENIDYSIFLSHEPDVIENYPIEDYKLILSGHTHGGQINIPLLPVINDYALSQTALASKYQSGLTKLDMENNPYLYINTGIGTTRVSARFMVVPEVTLFEIYL